MTRVIDLRHEQSEPAPKSRSRGGRTVRRDPKKIVGVVIHQTAIGFSVSPAQLAASGGDRGLALARRGLRVPAHVEAFRPGVVAITDSPLSYLHCAGRLNRCSVSEEVDGLYPGLLDRPDTVPREDLRTTWGTQEPMRFEGPIVDAAREGLGLLVDMCAEEGCNLRYVWAHRQSSARRRADPGEEIWRELVLGFAVPVLGLETQPARTWGDGRPIPREWDPDGVGAY